PRVRLADMSGDGMQDLVLVHNGRVDYWPYQGYGRWGKRVTMTQSPRFADAAYAPLGYDPRRILLGDIDGDGCADLVYVGFDHVTIWINGSGNGWSAPIVVRGTPMMSDRASVRLADMHGTGTAGILWTYDYEAHRDSTYKFLDLTGGVKPYLLNGMDNHLGAQTRVEYTSSTQMYIADQQRRESRWQTTLPFPVQVVRRVETIDAISGSKHTTEFRYHHGYWDGAEREFRGFGRVDQRDTETFDAFNTAGDRAFNAVIAATFSPPTETRTWFHLGPVGPEFGDWRELDLSAEFWAEDRQQLARPASVAQFLDTLPRRARRDAVRALRGRVLRTELYGLDGGERASRPYTVTETQYGVTDLPAATPDAPWRQQIFFPYTVALRTTQWERGDDPSTHIVFSDDYDAYGQSRQQTSVALPRRSARRQTKTGATIGAVLVDETRVLATHTRTVYATPDPAVYLFDREAQRRIFELAAPPSISESAPADLVRVLAEQIAAAQALHSQFRALLDPWNPSQPLPAQLRLTGHTLNYYDGAASADPTPAGRPLGQVGPYGALVRSEMLLFGDADLAATYGDRLPAYLGGSATLPPGAPAITAATLGYRRAGAGEQPGYYITTAQQRYDFHDPAATQRRGMVLSTRDALGAITTLTLDAYWLLPTLVRDPIGLETRAVHDYRLFQPLSVTDANNSTTHTRYTPLGFVRKTFVQGQDGAGGTEAKPAIEWSYDLFAYERTRNQPEPQPILVRSRRRVWHASENRGDELIEQYEYSDGFGRLIQTRAQAEDLVFGLTGDDVGLAAEAGTVRGPARGQRAADRVIVSGWKIYDNKGRVVEQYEPLLATGWQYRRSEAQGPHLSFFYDPRGQLVRTRNPDGSEQRIVRGVPGNLAAPTSYAPTPWERFTYDANDLAPLSADPTTGQPLTERAPASHHFTPTSELVDALGRVLCRIERNGANPTTDWLLTRFQYDGRGNLRAVVDPLGRTTVEQHYDLQKRVVRVVSVDAGNRSSVLDALGNLIEYRDSKGSLTLRQYDPLHRLTQLWARNTATAPLTLRERLHYGDGGTAAQPPAERLAERALNRLGRLARHYDEAGRLDFARYDLLGNLLEKTRRVIGNSALANGWTADWSVGNSENALDATGYVTSTRYDALGRIVQLTTPTDVNNARAVLTPRYNRAGTLERVELDGQPYVTQIAYNARGQRVLIAYGNGVMTRYAYDPRSFVLNRARSERFSASTPDTWTGTGAPLQELFYSYDLIGNLTTIDERTPGCGVAGSPEGRDRLLRRFGYDPLYRLIQADGRACKDLPVPRPSDDLAVCGAYPYRGSPAIPNQNNAPELTERYTESYSYDLLGNLLTQSYQAASRWNRTYTPEAGTNRLRQVVAGSSPAQSFTYDANGNLRQQNTERQYVWDHADRLVGYLNQVGSAKPTIEAQYLYGADGQRVKKWVKTKGGGGAESTVTIDGVF
ncbi:MAG: VCBS repeat-containing protein, partial [Chloroflexi bacterium]|nr:VCBS repeat-containing protein [Chloroflexota bacterium]